MGGGGRRGDNGDEERWLIRVGRMDDGVRSTVEDNDLCKGLDLIDLSLKTLVIVHIRKSRLFSRVRISVGASLSFLGPAAAVPQTKVRSARSGTLWLNP